MTIDPSPANGAPAALAHDLLYALGKRLPAGGEIYGTWADSQRPAWDAAATWILAHRIGHLIIVRTDRLTAARRRQLLALRERCGIRLTLLWHRPVSPAVKTLLEQIPHQIVDRLPQARDALGLTAYTPTGEALKQHQPRQPSRQQDDGQWIALRPPSAGVVVHRTARAPCQGASEAAPTSPPPTHRHDRASRSAEVLAARLGTVAHPLHAAALTIHAVTAADLNQLSLIRGIDINDAATVVKVHDSAAHRRCRTYPLPAWARPLIQAAGIHGQLNDRAPESPLLPLIAVRQGHQLHHSAAGIRYTLAPTP
ncbi:hypothetical protein ACFXKS_35020 [Streptomyces scopuliridis]|uniref:hypothetical protein n=1 Tax=Streptomyces scopuliridis TaxID=452529 RepID=UPI0036939353